MENRLSENLKAAPLPNDYITMVSEVFTANFEAGLKTLSKLMGKSRFEVNGEIFPKEIVVAVSIITEGRVSATTVYASSDFDPKASSPNIADLLPACVDGIGAIYAQLFSKERLKQLAAESLSALDDIPFDWSEIEVDKRKLFVKVDKSNPSLDKMADDWLTKPTPKRNI